MQDKLWSITSTIQHHNMLIRVLNRYHFAGLHQDQYVYIYIGLFGESRTEPGILQHAVAVVTQVVGTWDSDTCASVYSHVQPQKLVCRDEAFPCGRGTFRKSR